MEPRIYTTPSNQDSNLHDLCGSMRSARELKGLSLADVSRITRIPKTSLENLEQGSFESLPAEVFVRGFLRAYAQCVGMSPTDTVRHYTTLRRCDVDPCARTPEERISDSFAEGDVDNGTDMRKQVSAMVLPPKLDAETGTRRGSVTLAVIILMIVATLTMSYMLREPAYTVDGVTQNDGLNLLGKFYG